MSRGGQHGVGERGEAEALPHIVAHRLVTEGGRGRRGAIIDEHAIVAQEIRVL